MMPQPQNLPSERRRYPRIVTSIPMNLMADKRNIRAETINLSLSGVYCRVDRPIEEMTCLEVILMLPDLGAPDDVIYVECTGVVVRTERSDRGWRIAVFFQEMGKTEKRKLANYIATHIA